MNRGAAEILVLVPLLHRPNPRPMLQQLPMLLLLLLLPIMPVTSKPRLLLLLCVELMVLLLLLVLRNYYSHASGSGPRLRRRSLHGGGLW